MTIPVPTDFEHWDEFREVCRRRCARSPYLNLDPEDLACRAWIRAAKTDSAPEHSRALFRYLCAIVLNHTREIARTKELETHHTHIIRQLGPPSPHDDHTVVLANDEATRAEVATALLEIISCLNERGCFFMSACYVLRRIFFLPYQDIALTFEQASTPGPNDLAQVRALVIEGARTAPDQPSPLAHAILPQLPLASEDFRQLPAGLGLAASFPWRHGENEFGLLSSWTHQVAKRVKARLSEARVAQP